MSVTEIPAPLVSEGSGEDRAALVGGLTELTAFLATHPDVPLPGIGGRVIFTIPVPQGPEWPRGRRLEALDEIALRLGVQVARRHGTLYAERPFGGVLLQAHVNDADYIPGLPRAAGAGDVIPQGGRAVTWTRCDTEEALAGVTARWAARGQQVRWARDEDEDAHLARLRDEAGRVIEVAVLAVEVTASGSAA